MNLRKGKQEQLGEKLLAFDFLKYADPLEEDSLKTAVMSSFNIYDDGNYRISHIDAEELAECSFEFFLPRLNEILAKRVFHLNVETSDNNEISHEIVINGETIQLFSEEELNDNSYWDTAPRNFFKKVNELLRNTGMEEQFYLLYGGNDLHTMLLTEQQFLIISEYYNGNEKESPYVP